MSGMQTKAAEEKRYTYSVRHAAFGCTEVTARDEAEAIQAAAARWDASFREIAGWCDVQYCGEARKIQCAGCGGLYYGRPGGLCTACMRKKEYLRATRPRFRGKDRRIER